MRSSRAIATFALVVLVLVRGFGMAAEAWTANQIECCGGRHGMDKTCCPHCPMHRKHAPCDGNARLVTCHHSGAHALEPAPPPIALDTPAIDLPAARSAAPPSAPRIAPASRIVHPETPPS